MSLLADAHLPLATMRMPHFEGVTRVYAKEYTDSSSLPEAPDERFSLGSPKQQPL